MSQTLKKRGAEVPDRVFTFSEARAAGLSQRRIYALRESGEIIALGGGLFRGADEPPADLDLIEIAERSPRATLCLATALARHGLIDAIPSVTELAIPRGTNRPSFRASHRLHSFDPATFEIGRDLVDVGARRPLGLYSAERSIIDAVRLRHIHGAEMAWEALRHWLSTPGCNPGRLIRMSSQFRGAERPLRHALEVLL